jgi:hypothetical protein
MRLKHHTSHIEANFTVYKQQIRLRCNSLIHPFLLSHFLANFFLNYNWPVSFLDEFLTLGKKNVKIFMAKHIQKLPQFVEEELIKK